MKKVETLTRIALVLIMIFSLFAIILQITNERTNALETTYEIITFSVGIIALTIAVLQGLSNAKTTRELNRMAREISESVKFLRVIDVDTDDIMHQIAENNILDHRILQALHDNGIGENDENRQIIAKNIADHLRKTS